MPLKILMQLMGVIFTLLRSLCTEKSDLAMEVLALRQQLAVLKRKNPRPCLDNVDRAFWRTIIEHFDAWADALIIVKPDTVIRLGLRSLGEAGWQKKRLSDFWRKKSTPGPGRPPIPQQHIDSIKRFSETRGIRGIATPYHAPDAQAHIERFMGTLRRELLDHIIVWNESQLRTNANEFIRWYNAGRVHQGIHGIPAPDPELAAPKPANGKLVARPVLPTSPFGLRRASNGLHHDYRLAA